MSRKGIEQLEQRLRRMCEDNGLELRTARDPDDDTFWVVDPDAEPSPGDPERWGFRGRGRPAHHFAWSGGTLVDVEDYLVNKGWEG